MGVSTVIGRRRIILVGAVAAVGLVSTTATGGLAQERKTTSSSDNVDSEVRLVVDGDPFTQEDLDKAEQANRIADQIIDAAPNFPDSYGGLRLADKASRVEVFLTQPDPRAEAFARGHGSQVSVTIRPATATARELDELHELVRAAVPDLEREGFDLNHFGRDGVDGEEVIQLESATPDQIADLEHRFGPHVRVQVGAVDGELLIDRAHDAAPWNGGAFITNMSGTCTSGIPAHNSIGQKMLITAAHCFPVGASIRNGSASIPAGTFPFIGSVFSRDLAQMGYDAELVGANSSDLTFTGGTTSTTRAEFVGHGQVQQGSYICHSGAYEGQHCTYVYGPPQACWEFDYPLPPTNRRWLCGLTYTFSTSVQTVGVGDSGGPVFQWVGSKVRAVGIVTIGDRNQPWGTCTNWYPQTTRNCYQNYWFTSIGPILSQWGIAVN